MYSANNFDNYGKFKKIDWDTQSTPVHWLKGEPILTYLGNLYIIVTAYIERFTITATKSILPEIKDEQLKQELNFFINEEISHAYQHTCVTNHLKKHEYPVNFIEKYAGIFFKICLKIMNKKSKIAFVLAMEFHAHELSLLALKNNLFPKNQLRIYDFIWWHAIEELSHADLCFRLYKATGGGYFRRILINIFFTCFSFFTAFLFMPIFFYTDLIKHRNIKFKQIKYALVYLFGVNGLFWQLVKPYFRFYNPSYGTEKTILNDLIDKDSSLASSVSLPYFDVIISELTKKNSPLAKSFGQHTHWGYYSNPKLATLTHDDFYNAACDLTKKVCLHAHIENKQAILDVGCGFGGTISYLNNTFTNMALTGINIDLRQLDRAKVNTQPQNNNQIQFIEGNACDMPLQDNTFDKILATECIFHFPSRPAFFKHANRVLKPGGTITITDFVPHMIFLPNCWLLNLSIAKRLNFFGYCNFNYTLRRYRKLAKQYGFEMEVEDISHNTLPTYKYLQKLSKMVSVRWHYRSISRIFLLGMRFITWTRLLSYKIITFKKYNNHGS